MTSPNSIYRKNRPAAVAANAIKQAKERASLDRERADRLTALDPIGTMSLAEIELIEIYRAQKSQVRADTLTVMRMVNRIWGEPDEGAAR